MGWWPSALALGAPNLCPTSVSMSTPIASTSTGSLPMLCAASVCTSTPGRARLHAAEISAIGCTAPTCGWWCNKRVP